jgi:hypothetical protein
MAAKDYLTGSGSGGRARRKKRQAPDVFKQDGICGIAQARLGTSCLIPPRNREPRMGCEAHEIVRIGRIVRDFDSSRQIRVGAVQDFVFFNVAGRRLVPGIVRITHSPVTYWK